MKLTKTAVEALAPRDKTYLVFDDDLAGFAVRVTPGGAKAWTVEYRPAGAGRRISKKRMTLGAVGTLSAEKARRAAQDVLAHARLGRDLAAERAGQRQAATVAELVGRFMAEEVRPTRKPRTVTLYADYFRLHVVPAIGTRKARDLSRADIARLHRKIGEKARVTANRCVVLMSGLFTWAASVGELPDGHPNPAKGITRFREEGRERFLSTEELAWLGATLALAETKGLPFDVDETSPNAKHTPKHGRTVMSPHSTGAVRLLLFTGCRLREVLGLKWSDIDFERGTLTLADSKTGKRTVWLSATALATLDTLAQYRLGDFVIAGLDPEKPRADLHKPWRQIVRHAGLDGVTLHTLRHTHASVGVAAGLGLAVVGSLLGHRQASTTQKYAHIGASTERRATETIGAEIAAAMGGPARPPPVPIRRR